MALFQLNVALPDRPGSLGLLASAIGAAGGDIRALAVVKAEDGKVISHSTLVGTNSLICKHPCFGAKENCRCSIAQLKWIARPNLNLAQLHDLIVGSDRTEINRMLSAQCKL